MTKTSKLYALSILLVLLIFIGKFGVDAFSENKKNYYLNVQSELLQAKYDTSYRYFKIMTNDIYEMYSQNKKQIKLLEKANTADENSKEEIKLKMYKMLQRNFKRLTNMGIAQVNFYLANNKVFLKMHKPEFKSQDSVQNISVELVSKTHKNHEGFEACGCMVGLRFTYPVYNGAKFVGTLEIAYSTRQLLKSITDDFVYNSHILVSKKMADSTLDKLKRLQDYSDTWESPDYYIEDSTHKSIGDINLYMKLESEKLKEEIAEGIKLEKPFAVVTHYNYQNIILTFLPMASANGKKNVSYVVTYTESDYLSNLKIEKNYILALYFVVIGLLYLFSIYVIYSQEKLKDLALYDGLTKLPNRTLFMVELANELHRSQRYKTSVALMFLDLDGFKAVNDTYGHQVGDKLLVHIAAILTSSLRESDLVARLGGDEFTIIITDIHEEKEVVNLAQKLIDRINQDIIIDHKSINVGASVGVSIYPRDAKEIDELVRQADEMMYESKNNGKNQVTLYNNRETNV